MDAPWPILEYDPDPRAMIQPEQIYGGVDLSERCVMCFFQEVIDDLRGSGRARQVAELRSEIGSNPVYEIVLQGEPITVLHPGVGAPLAASVSRGSDCTEVSKVHSVRWCRRPRQPYRHGASGGSKCRDPR